MTTNDGSVPRLVSVLPDGVLIKSIGPSGAHTCAVIENGSVYCCLSSNGRLGAGDYDGDGEPPWVLRRGLRPIQPDLPNNSGHASKIEASPWGTCVLMVNGSVYCWGEYVLSDSQDIQSNQYPPPLFNFLHADAVDIDMGTGHYCVILDDGTVACWGGSTRFGRLGDGNTTAEDYTPVIVALPGAEAMLHLSQRAISNPAKWISLTSWGTLRCI